MLPLCCCGQAVLLSLSFAFHIITSLAVGPVLLFAPHLYVAQESALSVRAGAYPSPWLPPRHPGLRTQGHGDP